MDIDPKIVEELSRAEVYTISTDELVPNPWNPNEMEEKAWTALGQSIAKYGIHLQPLVVRPLRDRFQIIDGEHRFRWAQEMAISSVSAIIINVDEFNAKKLTQILNRTRGDDNPVKLKELLDSLLVDHSPGDVIDGMAIADERELDFLLQKLEDEITVSNFDWDKFENQQDPTANNGDNERYIECPECGHKWTK